MVRRFCNHALILACFLFVGCTTKTVPFPEILGTKLNVTEVEEILRELTQNDNEVTSFRTLSRTRFEEPDDSYSVRHALVFSKPSSLRIETLPVNSGYTLSLLTASEGSATFLYPPDEIAIVGSSGAKLLKKIIRIPATEREIMSLLSGRVPAKYIESTNLKSFTLTRSLDGSEVAIVRGANQHYWLVESDSLRLRKVQIRDADGKRIRLAVSYESFQTLDSGIEVPSRFTVSLPDEDLVLRFLLQGPRVNEEISPELFVVEVPKGYSQRNL